MSLEKFKNYYILLVECLGNLEQQEILASGEEKFNLEKKIQRYKEKIAYWNEQYSNNQLLVDILPHDFGADFLLDTTFDQDFFQPVEVKLNNDSGLNLSSKSFSAHLIVATFWKKRSSKEFHIKPELYYQHPETGKHLKESLSNDLCSESLPGFPNFLQKLTQFAATKLSKIYDGILKPWQLTIELFVPIDLLSSPLTQWCGEASHLTQVHPIVIRCSDRFDPERSSNLANASNQLTPEQLHNQLKAGWQRFQQDLPDDSPNTLHSLRWLDLCKSSATNPERYSGLKCHGTWLTSHEKDIEHWEVLVTSGIPLALWLTHGQANHPQIPTIYSTLTHCNRFEFLERVRDVLNQQMQSQNCHYYVGVFYEDPNYVPTVPKSPEEQFFSWPGST